MADDQQAWITDVHTHILPPRLALKIRRMFEAAENGLQPGPVENSGSCCTPAYDLADKPPSFDHHGPFELHYPAHYTAEVDEIHKSCRIRSIWVLPYAHKGDGMAKQLNHDVSKICQESLDKMHAVAALTVHPEDGSAGVEHTTRDAILRLGCRAAKLHCSVGRYNVLESALDPFWSIADATRLPVIVHVGGHVSGHTGEDELDAIEELLKRFHNVPLVIAHSAAPATQRAIELALNYSNVYLDTTPIVTHCVAYPPSSHHLHEPMQDLARSGRILFGSDFPNVVVTLDDQIKHVYKTFADPTWTQPSTANWWLDRREAQRAGNGVTSVLGIAAARLQAKFKPEALDELRHRI